MESIKGTCCVVFIGWNNNKETTTVSQIKLSFFAGRNVDVKK